MSEFNRYILEQIVYEHLTLFQYLPREGMMRDRAHGTTEGLPQRQPEPVKGFMSHIRLGRDEGVRNDPNVRGDRDILKLRVDAATACKEDLDEFRRVYTRRINKLGQRLLYTGMFANVSCAALLLGMYFQTSYPDTPYLWMVYSAIVGCGVPIWLVLQWMWRHQTMFSKLTTRTKKTAEEVARLRQPLLS